MLVLDNNLLSDYLAGRAETKAWLKQYDDEVWAISSIVMYEAYMGSLYGYIDASRATVREAIMTSMEVLEVTERTAREAATLQEELHERGVPADHPDALIAAATREHGGTFATAERHFWTDEVQAVLDVAAYDVDEPEA